jgi:hypothetical protein
VSDTSTFITMRHPDVEGTAQVPEQAFRQVWKARGWEEVDPAALAASDILGRPVDDVSKLSKDDAETVAEQLGADTSGNPTKAELVDKIDERVATVPPTTDNAGVPPQEG